MKLNWNFQVGGGMQNNKKTFLGGGGGGGSMVFLETHNRSGSANNEHVITSEVNCTSAVYLEGLVEN